MHVAELWVYPVKSLAGQRIGNATLTADGIPGDRRVVVRDRAGALVTARTRHDLLRVPATLGPGAIARVDGAPWDAPGAREAVRRASGDDLALAAVGAGEGFDDTPLLVATDGAVAALGVDRRRLRPNLVIGGVDGLEERRWPGRRLVVGTAVIAVERVCRRCVMTTLDPDTAEVDAGVLRAINDRYDGRFALNCRILEPGEVAVGDPVELR